MSEHKKSLRLSLIMTYVFMALLVIITCTLPWLITLYVEKMDRSMDLATIVMLSYYPCVPVAAKVLFDLKKLLKNLIGDDIANLQNVKLLRTIAICCMFVGIFLIVMGFFYMPFYFLGAAAAFCALLIHVFKNIIHGICIASDTESIDN